MSDVLHPTPQTPERLPEVPEHELHELPEGVVVPDDLAALGGTETPSHRTRGPRWLYWLAGVIVLAAGTLILVSVFGDDGAEQPTTPASDIVEANRAAALQDLAAQRLQEAEGNLGPDPTARR